MVKAIGTWLKDLEDYPGWRERRRKRLGHTLHFDDPLLKPSKPLGDFTFSDKMEKQHAVVFQYLELHEAISALRECEYYFRRYPFRGLPVTRHNHITNICEMYFGRFYEFRERLKRYFAAVKAAEPKHQIDVGGFIKIFDKEFDQELRARNGVHHHSRFGDVTIDRVFLTGSISMTSGGKGWEREHLAAYRKTAKEWAERVRRRGETMDQFLEVVADATLRTCTFLSTSRSAAPNRGSNSPSA